jgi:hypothetical protein
MMKIVESGSESGSGSTPKRHGSTTLVETCGKREKIVKDDEKPYSLASCVLYRLLPILNVPGTKSLHSSFPLQW